MRDIFDVPDKDPGFVYRWVNTDERAMLMRKSQGYEVVMDEKPELPSLDPANATPGATTRKRGADLVLCRIPKKAFEENIESRRRAMREHHAGAVDSSVDAVNSHARSEMTKRYGQGAPKRLAFKTSADQSFDDAPKA